jgi:hypothetical protein
VRRHKSPRILVALAAAVVVLFAPAASAGRPSGWILFAPPIEATFARPSYAPGQVATLNVYTRTGRLTLTIGRADSLTAQDNIMLGTVVKGPLDVGPGSRLHVWIGNWPSGLYFARLDSADGHVGFAPFVLRPRTFGERRVAVVLPTNTWQAYNLRDSDHDGVGDTWYASSRIDRVDVTRPFLDNVWGVKTQVPPGNPDFQPREPFLTPHRGLVMDGHSAGRLRNRRCGEG